jgi:L-rhamnose mutarotase
MRVAFRMRINPGQEAEYIARHNPIWPELEATLIAHGVRTYSIYLDRPTGDLFAYAEIEDLARWQAIAATEICRKWWDHMAPLMPTNPDSSPIVGDLEEVFHIEANS